MAVATSMFDLSGQSVLITGGASGLGLAMARAMRAHGARVLVGSRSADKVEQAVATLHADEGAGAGGHGGSDDDAEPAVAGVTLDVTRRESVARAVRKAVDLFGGLHVLVNAAGVTRKVPTFDLPDDEAAALYDTHVLGSLRAAQEAGRLFREQHQGCVINLASIASFGALTEVTAYAMAKSAVLGLTRNLATEWAKHGVRCNAIAPGFIPTDLNRHLIEGTDRGRRVLERTPMGRFGTADEVAGAAVYLASPAASFVNGQTLVVDGGFLSCAVGEAEAPWAAPAG
ncbi:MAG: SDR family oxidoreductase [Planctomycetota bacterium]